MLCAAGSTRSSLCKSPHIVQPYMGYRFTDTNTSGLYWNTSGVMISGRMLCSILCSISIFRDGSIQRHTELTCQSDSHKNDFFQLTWGSRSHFQVNGAGTVLEQLVKGNPICSLAGHVVLFGFPWESHNETIVNEKNL